MSFLNSLFGASPATPAAPATPSTPAAPAQATNTPATNADTANAPQSPMDQFKDWWNTEGTNTGNQEATSYFNADPAKFSEGASKVDFTRVIDPTVLAAIGNGGEDAVKAFSFAMNKVAQQAYAQSAYASSQMIEQALAKAEERFSSKVPDMVKRHQLDDSLKSSNPMFSHPAAAPILDGLKSQLAVKFPNATVSELTKMAQDYLVSFSSAAGPVTAPNATQEKANTEVDWFATFGLK